MQGTLRLVGDGTLIGRGHDRYPNECRMGALAVLHPGVPVMWHTHIRDLFPTAEAVRERAHIQGNELPWLTCARAFSFVT